MSRVGGLAPRASQIEHVEGSFSRPAPGGESEPKSQVELSLSCRNLPNMDHLSKSDPLCVVFISTKEEKARGNWTEVGRTEEIRDDLNPNFATPVLVEYRFEERQYIRIVVVDIDDRKSESLERQDFLGECELELAKLLTNPHATTTTPLMRNGRLSRATITIKAEEMVASRQVISLQFAATNVDKMDFFGKSDPYLIIQRSREDGTWVPVYRTEVVKYTLNPQWLGFSLSMVRLCNGDADRALRIDCFDWNARSAHDYIGSTHLTLNDMLYGDRREWSLINEEKQRKKKKYVDSGKLRLVSGSSETRHTFLDYVLGGCEISMMVAIDFTASNGDPSRPGSLHYSPPGGMSDYEKAMRAVGEIVSAYDSDGYFPVSVFGVKYFDQRTGNQVVSHCHDIAPSPNGVQGLEGLVEAYRAAVHTYTFWGPTNFAQIVDWASRSARQAISQAKQHYTILLIITDGVITDLQATKERIIGASSLPLSIIIVGVGDADFDAMDELDSDDKLLSSGNLVAQRDIVQFVPFRQFVYQSYEALAKHTLEEVPRQLLSFMHANNLQPGPGRLGVQDGAVVI